MEQSQYNNVQFCFQRPDRYCKFCLKVVSCGKLKRHLLRKHKSEEEVKKLKRCSTTEQQKLMTTIKKDGIYKYNKEALSEHKDLMRERKAKFLDKLRMCSLCTGFYSSRNFHRHRKECGAEAESVRLGEVIHKEYHHDKDFTGEILDKFHENDVGNLCRENDTIKRLGYRHFCVRKHDKEKKDEMRKSVMSEMRQLARLNLAANEIRREDGNQMTVNIEDLFTRPYLNLLLSAVERLCNSANGSEKYGSKMNYKAVIMRTIKVLRGFYAESCQEQKKEETDSFKLAFEFRAPEVFSSAESKCCEVSMNKNRRPEALPSEDGVLKFKQFIESQLKLIDSVNFRNYIWLRNLVVCRLTLYNARRGDEPSRLTIQQYQDALNDVWLPKNMVEAIDDPAEQYLIGLYKLAYLKGKGKAFVPILIPSDLVPYMAMLFAKRHLFVKDDNQFFFGTSKTNHCSGWHAVQEVARRAAAEGIDVTHINATKMRHRISTIYAALDMPQDQQEVFLNHMGHAKRINSENYQCPYGVKEVRVMGKLLANADKGKLDYRFIYSSHSEIW